MQQIFEGLYVVSRMGTNVYLLESAPDELTVIDTGMPSSTGAILKAAQSLNYRPQQIKHILLTHADIDHVGSLSSLVKKTGATVYAGKASKPYVENGSTPPHVPSFMKIMNVFLSGTPVDEVFDDHDMLPIADGLLALHVPGHTPENYNFFWEKHGVLFAADLFFSLGSSVTLSPRLVSWDSTQVQRSARKVLDLAPKYICAGHGAPVNLVRTPEKIVKVRRILDGATSLAAT